jgi:hypothetical protein
MTPGRSERGIAVLLALIAVLFMTALGGVLTLTSVSETMIAGGFRSTEGARYAAEAAAERVLADLAAADDWNPFFAGTARSTFVDGPPAGTRAMADGTTIDLTQHVNQANCQKTTACSIAEMDAFTADRPWGVNNPRWRLLAYAPLSALLPTAIGGASYYAVVLIGDDRSETDGDPTRDGSDPANPGSGIVVIRATAFGPRGSSRAIELTVSRPAGDGEPGDYNDRVRQRGVSVLSWNEVR